MISSTGSAATAEEEDLPTRTFSPPAAVVIGTLVVGIVFLVVLEFLVIISFLGQRLWNHPLLLHDLWFTLPLLLWVLMAVAVTVTCLRVMTSWLQIDEQGVELRSLFRRTVAARWDEVGAVIAVRSLSRGASPAETTDEVGTAYDGVYVMDQGGTRLFAVSSRFFGLRAQQMALRRAREAGVAIEHIDAITAADLLREAPQALTFVDRHPNLLLLALVLFYAGHNVLTFAIWGL